MASLSLGPAAGTGASSTIQGDDLGGVVTVTTGTLPSISDIVFTLTFGRTFGKVPIVQAAPANSATAILGVGMTYVDYSESATSAWKLRVPAVALAAAVTYAWSYKVVGFLP